jgi:hypothetical protein
VRSAAPSYTEDPSVYSDIVRSPYSSIFDDGPTSVVDDTQITTVAR